MSCRLVHRGKTHLTPRFLSDMFIRLHCWNNRPHLAVGDFLDSFFAQSATLSRICLPGRTFLSVFLSGSRLLPSLCDIGTHRNAPVSKVCLSSGQCLRFGGMRVSSPRKLISVAEEDQVPSAIQAVQVENVGPETNPISEIPHETSHTSNTRVLDVATELNIGIINKVYNKLDAGTEPLEEGFEQSKNSFIKSPGETDVQVILEEDMEADRSLDVSELVSGSADSQVVARQRITGQQNNFPSTTSEAGSLKRDNEDSLLLQSVIGNIDISESFTLAEDGLLKSCTEADLYKRIEFLREIGIESHNLAQTICKCPSLLTRNLSGDLYHTLKCMESLCLRKSLIGELLTLDPKLIEHLNGPSFVIKVKLLKDFGFAMVGIGKLLNKLSCKIDDFAKFLRLPHFKLVSPVMFLKKLGLKQRESCTLLSVVPSLFLCNATDLELKISSLKVFSEDKNVIGKMIASCPLLLLQTRKCLFETLDYLEGVITDRENVVAHVMKYPGILLHCKNAIQPVLMFLESLGLERKCAAILLIRQPFLIECGTEGLCKHVEFFKSKGLGERTICKLVLKCSAMFAASIEKRVAPKIKALENHGIVGKELDSFLLSRPQSLRKTLQGDINRKINLLMHLGFQENSPEMLAALKASLQQRNASMGGRIKQLVEFGITHDKACRMVRDAPGLFNMNDGKLREKVKFLVNTMCRSVNELEECPTYLFCSLENKIKPRFRILNWLRSIGVLEEDPPLSTIVNTPEDVFRQQFVECHAQGPAIYQGNPLELMCLERK